MDLQQEQAQLFQVGKTELMETAAVCSTDSDGQQRPTRACLKNQPSKKKKNTRANKQTSLEDKRSVQA